MKRIFEGDPKVPLRKGFKKIYGRATAGQHDIEQVHRLRRLPGRCCSENKDIEAVVIALPLHLHAKAAIDAMQIGKERGKPIHVLCEKLMAWNISQCKEMIEVAKETGSILSIGHQRHYSMLYAHAVEVINAGVLGDVKHIRALWHRNFTWPFKSTTRPASWSPGSPQPMLPRRLVPPGLAGGLRRPGTDKVKQYGYDSVEQLIRWRLYNETGGGLMAELGSHQLDACSIFLGKVHPLAVTGVGVKSFTVRAATASRQAGNDREIDDHVFVTYEFPGKNHPPSDKNDVVVVTYSSISTNQFEPYGECVMGTRGTMIVEGEQSVMLYTEKEPGKKGDAQVAWRSASARRARTSRPWNRPRPGAARRRVRPPTAAPAGGGRPGQPRLPRGDGGLRLLHPPLGPEARLREGQAGQVRPAPAALPRRGRDGRRHHRADRQPGDAQPRAHRVPRKWFDADSAEVPDGDSKPKIPVV